MIHANDQATHSIKWLIDGLPDCPWESITTDQILCSAVMHFCDKQLSFTLIIIFAFLLFAVVPVMTVLAFLNAITTPL